MKKLLFTFALAGVVLAGAASRACAYWAHVVIENRTSRTKYYQFSWGSNGEAVELKPGYHKDHWYKYTNGLPGPEWKISLAAGKGESGGLEDINPLPFGFDNRPTRYIIQADPRDPWHEYITDDRGQEW